MTPISSSSEIAGSDIDAMAEPRRPLVIYGAGGHGQVVAEAATVAGRLILGFLDDTVTLDHVGAWRIVDERIFEGTDAGVLVAVGDNFARRRISDDMREASRPPATVIHPTAWVSPSAQIGEGVFIGPRAVVNAEARIGDGAIINSGAIIEHHCRVGPFAHVAPGATLAGGVRIGQLTLVGVGASLLPNIEVGDDSTVGAGAVVTQDVRRGTTVVGSPAQPTE